MTAQLIALTDALVRGQAQTKELLDQLKDQIRTQQALLGVLLAKKDSDEPDPEPKRARV